MYNYIFVFSSLTDTNRAKKRLSEKKIHSEQIKIPRSLVSTGCANGIALSESSVRKAYEALSEHGILPIKIFQKYKGSFTEVML